MQGRKLFSSVIFLGVLFASTSFVLGLPTLQVYPVGGTAGNYGPDQDTWFIAENPFDIKATVAFNGSTEPPLLHLGLLFAVPEGETGVIDVSGTSANGSFATKSLLQAQYPQADVTATSPVTSIENTYSVDPLDMSILNNHYPLQDDISDFYYLEIDEAVWNDGQPIDNYNAETGIIEVGAGVGTIYDLTISVSGLSQVHIDALGYAQNLNGQGWVGSWELNPGSHDTTYIPAPGALLLVSIGVGGITFLRRRKLV